MAVCGKRFHFDSEHPLLGSPPSAKRTRWTGSLSPHDRSLSPHPILDRTAKLERLKQARPDMPDEVISKVLRECHDDLDLALESLCNLKLHPEGNTISQKEVLDNVPAVEAAKQEVEKEAEAANAKEEEQTAVEGARTPPTRDPPKPHEINISDEWVDAVVQHLSGATDIDEAKGRARQVLQTFASSMMQTASVENQQLRSHVQSLERDTQILKRAVAIQNSRQHELTKQAADLEQVVLQYQAKLRDAEMSNYTLSFHLKQVWTMFAFIKVARWFHWLWPATLNLLRVFRFLRQWDLRWAAQAKIQTSAKLV